MRLAPYIFDTSKRTYREFRRSVTTIFVSVIVAQVAFINAISGVTTESNLKIMAGLGLQVSLGALLVRVFLQGESVPLGVQIGAGFVLGIPVVILLGRGILEALSVVAITLLILLQRYRRRRRRSGQIGIHQQAHEHQQLTCLAVTVVVINLVFLRIHQTPLGLTVLMSSLSLIVVPYKHLARILWIYFAVMVATIAVRSVQIGQSSIFTYFRFTDDWLEDQVFAQSLASTGTRSNPFVFGDTIVYHFFSQLYWGSFEKVFRSDIFAFSGPALLACCVAATSILVANSSLVAKVFSNSSQRMILLIVLFSSWPFSDSFKLDNASRSQSLSIAIGALILYLLTKEAGPIRLLLLPVLTSFALLTKVSTGLFVCTLLAFYFVGLVAVDSTAGDVRAFSRKKLRIGLIGLTLCGVWAVSTVYYFFLLPSPLASYGRVVLDPAWPDIAIADREVVNWVQYGFAFLPIVMLLFVSRYDSLGQTSRNEYVLRNAVVAACVSTVLFWSLVSSESGIEAHFYAVGLSASLGFIAFVQLLTIPSTKQFWLTFSFGSALATVGFTLIERRPAPHGLMTESVLLIVFAFGLVTVTLILLKLHVLRALIVALLAICVGSSGSQVIHNRTNGVFKISVENNPIDQEYRNMSDAILFLGRLERTSVFAVENPRDKERPLSESGSVIRDLYFLLGSTSLQLWIEPNHAISYFGNNQQIAERLQLQDDLVMSPTAHEVTELKSQGVTHLILFSESIRQKWHNFALDITENDASSTHVVYRDEVLEVVEL